MLILPQFVYDQLRRHGEACYPEECCGILIGAFDSGCKAVVRAVATRNASSNPHKHYEIDAHELIHLLRQAHTERCEVLGFYHSHPDRPAHWSPTDFAEAHWLGFSYVITTIENGMAAATNAFHLAGSTEEDKYFELEKIAIIRGPHS
jgi:proteasome lid subunit RPN8/RPN11